MRRSKGEWEEGYAGKVEPSSQVLVRVLAHWFIYDGASLARFRTICNLMGWTLSVKQGGSRCAGTVCNKKLFDYSAEIRVIVPLSKRDEAENHIASAVRVSNGRVLASKQEISTNGIPSGAYRGFSYAIALDGGPGSGNRSGQPRGRSSRAPERRYVVEWQASPEVDDVLIRFLNDVGHVYRMPNEHPLRGLGMQHRMVDMMKNPKNLANELRFRFGDKVHAKLISTVKKPGDFT